MKEIKIFTGRSYPELAKKICQQLDVPLSPLKIQKYANGCFEVILKDAVRKKTVFLIQTSLPDTCQLHQNFWELCQMTNAALKSGAKEAIVIMPYISYARSDKIDSFGMTISGELLAKLLEASGMTRFIGIDFHSKEFEKFFSKKTKVYHLSALSLISEYLKKKNFENVLLLPADKGALKGASLLAEKLNVPVGTVEKTRISDNKVRIEKISGEIYKKDIIIFDDEISTATTVKVLGKEIEKRGAKNLTVAVTHGLFAKGAVKNLQTLKILKEIIVTDTIPVPGQIRKSLPLKVLSIAEILSKKIGEIAKES